MGRGTGDDKPRGSGRRKPAKISAPADYIAVDWGKVGRSIAAVAGHGGAIRLGYSRDGGAYAVGVYGDGDTPYTEYVRPDEDFEAYMAELAEAFNDEAEERAQAQVKLRQAKLPHVD